MSETTKITTRIEVITPKKAEQYLALKTINRPIRKPWVKELAQMMRDGDFHLTHQGIAFNCDGSLSDGEHRLRAIVESGCYVPMNVSRGLTEEARKAIDTGKNRSVADALNLSGHASDSRSVAIGRRMMEGMTLDKTGNHGSRPAIIRFLIEHASAIEFARHQPGRNALFLHASLRAPVARAFYSENEARLEEFMLCLCSGFPKSDDDKAAILLRNHYLANRALMGRHRGALALYQRTEAMLRDFLDRTDVNRVHKADRELFPLPGEAKRGTKAKDRG
jgi:hypothetical protein